MLLYGSFQDLVSGFRLQDSVSASKLGLASNLGSPLCEEIGMQGFAAGA